MKRFLWIIPVVILVGVIIGIVIWKKKQDARPFNVYEFPSSISVTNGTDSRADTLVLVLAHNVFEMDTLDVKIFYLPESVNEGDIEFFGITQKLPFGNYARKNI